MFRAKGYYRAGLGYAHRNLELQIPRIETGFPEIRDFYRATINVRCEPKIVVAVPDHRTPPIRWCPDTANSEVFDLLRIRLVFSDLGTQVRALLYVAHWSGLRNDPHKHEFVAQRFVDGLCLETTVIMECDRQAIELPYTSFTRRGNGRPRLARTFVVL